MTNIRRGKRPMGQPTRGKTALNRLRQIDVYAALALENTLVGGRPLIVDVGYGAYPWTALEMLERLRRVNPNTRLVGIEIDPERVAVAQPYAVPGQIAFHLGGFNLAALLKDDHVRLIRAYNVLRQYDESAVVPALQEMARVLEPGGVLIEGTCNPTGRMAAFDVYRMAEDGLKHEALVFGSNLRAPVDAVDFQTILPKRLIHHMLDPALAMFFDAWQRAFLQWKSTTLPPRQVWVNTALSLMGYFPIDLRFGLIRRGYLTLRSSLIEVMLSSVQ